MNNAKVWTIYTYDLPGLTNHASIIYLDIGPVFSRSGRREREREREQMQDVMCLKTKLELWGWQQVDSLTGW
jgi:hypothetical protein